MCQNRYETLHIDRTDEETEKLSGSYTSSLEETPDNTPKQVFRSIISKRKRLKNKDTITGNQLNHQTIPVIEGNNYDAVATKVSVNDFVVKK